MNRIIMPARKGSKRLPGKNIIDFLGFPIWVYPARKLRQLQLGRIQSNQRFKLYASSDDNDFLRDLEEFNFQACFRHEFCDDKSNLTEVVRYHITKRYDFVFNEPILDIECDPKDKIIIVYPTAVFLDPHELLDGIELMDVMNYDCVYPVIEDKKNWHHVGEWFICKPERIKEGYPNPIISGKQGRMIKKGFGIDIHTKEDLEIAKREYIKRYLDHD